MGWNRWARVGGAALVLWSGACSDGTGPTSSNRLASALDDLTRQANRDGDLDGGAAFSSAALAIRLGVVPTPFAVEVDGVTTELFGIVHEVAAGQRDGSSLRLRTLVAVDRVDRPERVLYLAVLADSGALGRPSVPLEQRADLGQLAWASWRDLASGQRWAAVTGRAGVVETATGGVCPGIKLPTPTGCVTAAFDGFLEGGFVRVGAPGEHHLTFQATAIHGAELTLSAP